MTTLICPYCLLRMDLNKPYVIDHTNKPAHPHCVLDQVRSTDRTMILHLPKSV